MESSGRALSTSWDATIKLWNTSTGDVLSTMSSGSHSTCYGDVIFVVGIGNALYCMSVLFENNQNNQNAVVAVGSRQCEVQEWSIGTNQRIHTYLGHQKEVCSDSFGLFSFAHRFTPSF
jgi:WD40 repeat protein